MKRVVVKVKYGKKAGQYRARLVGDDGGFTYLGTYFTEKEAEDAFETYSVSYTGKKRKIKHVVKVQSPLEALATDKVDLKAWEAFSRKQIIEISRNHKHAVR